MNKLEQAARALLAHWDTPAWKYLKPTGDLMADLREALAGDNMTPTEQVELNLNCKSVQARLATSWGYVKAEQADEEGKITDYMLGFSDGKHYAHKYEQAEQSQLADASLEPVAWIELLREARDNCKASIVEEGISAVRKEYRIDLEARLSAVIAKFKEKNK